MSCNQFKSKMYALAKCWVVISVVLSALFYK